MQLAGMKPGQEGTIARIVAVADTLSALLRNRSYRSGCSFGDACAEIRRCSGSQFDPAVVGILEKNREEVARRLAEGDDFFRCDGPVPLVPVGVALTA